MNDKINMVKLWIEKADHDLGTAELTFRHIPKYRDTIAFHCQQAVEKYLKSYFIFIDLPVIKTHDLIVLLGLIANSESVSDALFDKAAELQDYSVEIRYPDNMIELTNEDIEIAIAITKDFRQFFLSKMNLSFDMDEL
jgi:HEPN domain-containing protein